MMRKLFWIYLIAGVLLFVLFCAVGARAQIKTQPAPTANRANAAATLQGGAAILIPPASNQGDNCSVPNTLAFGNTNIGLATNFQRETANCVRLRDVRAWLDISVVTGNKFFALVAAQRMLQDAASRKAYDAALNWK